MSVVQAIADAHRREWARVLAATVRVSRDLDVAEESVQDAYVAALTAWERDGIPERPGAWLTTAARNKALSTLARRQTLESKLPLLIGEDPEPETDRLRLVFTCCHPALSIEARVALTLRMVCGVSTPDVASAFLVSEATMAARITRAKKKITAARIPYRVPSTAELPERLDAVLTVVHLLATAGHTAPSGDALLRVDLTERAVDLARMLHALLPAEPEVGGLLALLLVHRAREGSRVGPEGRLVRLAEQDRSIWDRDLIAEADRLVVSALRAGPAGRFSLQAAIAALHAQAPSYDSTDWTQIRTLYDALYRVWPTPVVALNRAVAVSMVDGPAAGLAELTALETTGELTGYHYLPAAKADLLRRLGRLREARDSYREAATQTDNAAEREYLETQL
ncbi:RNA polymerase sigma factor [Cryptosporangium sp. NPDC051539]|uniref:RNA polymerase sigma factor n=1 Tax=Cryptosporangium sp. NPDC051539 TaxID=3363962 RepID=UPI00378D195C